MIVTPWETMTCEDDSHEWDDEILTMPTDATATIAEAWPVRLARVCTVRGRTAAFPGARNPGGR